MSSRVEKSIGNLTEIYVKRVIFTNWQRFLMINQPILVEVRKIPNIGVDCILDRINVFI